MAVVLWVVVRAKIASAKSGADLEDTSSSESPNQGFAKSTFESLFNEFVDVPEFETASQAPEVDPFLDFENFEQQESEMNAASAASAAEALQEEEASKVAENPIPEFDLRQAVIYQTILTNKYLSEMPSHEN